VIQNTLKIAVGLIILAAARPATAENKNAGTRAAGPASFTAMGTWNGMPVMTALIRQYQGQRGAGFVRFTPLNSDQIVGYVSGRRCDVGMTLDSLVTEDDKPKADRLQKAVLGRFALGIAVNARNPLRTIALDDLGKIFAAQVTAWNDVPDSGLSTPIEITGRAAISTEGMIVGDKVLRGRPFAVAFFDQSATPPAQKETDEQVVAALIKRPNAIGFLRYSAGAGLDKRVRVLGIVPSKGGKAVFPTAATIADGSYPLTDSLTLYLQPAAPQSAREFCRFAAGPEGAKIVKQCGLWPEYELNEVRGVKRLQDVKAHRGVEVAVGGSAALQSLMKELGAEFSKTKTAVEIKYHAGTPNAAIGEFVGGEASQPAKSSPPTGKSEIRMSKSEQPSLPAPLPEGEGRTELVLIDAMLETKTVHEYDQAWKAIRPAKVTLGWRAAALVVHPTNPVSTLSWRQLRDIYGGQATDWFDVGRIAREEQAGSAEQAARPESKEEEARRIELTLHFGTIHLYGPPPEDPISRLVENRAGWKQHVKLLPRADIAKLIQTVARDPLALGIVDLSQLPPGEASVKVLALWPGTAAPTRHLRTSVTRTTP
jgi:ABC-type phosphate transport system substrate-binding protein